MSAYFAIQGPVNAEAAAENSSRAKAAISFLEAGPEKAVRQVENNRAQAAAAGLSYETTFRFRYHENGNWQWVADAEVEEANGYAVLAAYAKAQAENCDLLHDLFGNPFRPVTVDPAWLTWHDGTVRRLAQVIYDERRFADLPILADALEEAGCDIADILDHCRCGGEHVRGCWAVDLILGRD